MASRKISFSDQELNIVDIKASMIPGIVPDINLLNTPISYRENTNAVFWSKEPCWCSTFNDFSMLNSPTYNTLLSRPLGPVGGNNIVIDAFNVPWEWVDAAGGAMTPGGNPLLTDVNDWKEKIIIPDVDSWDWAGEAKEFKLDPRFASQGFLVNGFWFERLISFMDFEGAALALVDEDQRDALHELFEALTEMACKIIDNMCEYWPAIDGFMTHDDWGSQKSSFFSDEIAREVFLPHMKKFNDHIHSKGRYSGLHSCGRCEDRVEVFIEAGFELWQLQGMNDLPKLYEAYGDKMVFEISCEYFDANVASEEEIRQVARNYVDNFCKPGKPSIVANMCGWAFESDIFMEELYVYSRKHYLKH